MLFYLRFTFNISFAEQSKAEQSLDRVVSVDCALPDRYCETIAKHFLLFLSQRYQFFYLLTFFRGVALFRILNLHRIY